ncbi:putative serine protease K12H4.7 isoform X3 [Trichoplusia ni]|uniref:Serine protease K12H4.7 isoform X3 n=1 Tax=Trichoplusia ni TaxID=7111 RepID=A0A7E5VW74_TRINI|nr:putative serine protease K12H4.7 isoform X3 [Trichoplusia ni]
MGDLLRLGYGRPGLRHSQTTPSWNVLHRAQILRQDQAFRVSNNTRLSSLQYLSVHQALADLAQFIHYIKSDAFEGGQYKSGRVVVVGCSYAGSMATWMRQTYPHLVDAAFSDSGPVLAQEAYPEYMTIVIKAIRERGGEACLDSISEGMKQLVKMLATIAKAKELSKMFNTCTPVQSSPPQDMTAFLEKIEDSFNELVQKSKNIPAACAVLTNASVSSPVRRLANYITSWSSKPCVDIRYTGRAPDYMNTSYDSENYAARLWMYQTCVEFGWYPISTSAHEPYFPRVPLEYYLQHCKDYFSEDFNEEQLRRGVQQTNIMFGGLKHRPDHLISVSGTHDPWSALAPNSSHARRNSPVYVIPGVAHCKAIRGPENGDSRELRNARRVVVNFMHNNIHRPIPLSDATYIQVTPVLLGLALVVLY